MSEAPGDGAGSCPFCGLDVDAGLSGPARPPGRRCPCGAIAFGTPEGGRAEAVDAMIAHYQISPSPQTYGDLHADGRWMKEFWIEPRAGASARGLHWHWFKRELPWEPPAGPMSDAERLAWFKAQGEKAYDLMYDSRRPADEYRDAKDYFESAVELARRMGRDAEADELARRLEHVKAVFRSQFNF